MDDWSLNDSPHFKPVFTVDEIGVAETNRQKYTNDMGATRRVSLALLTKSYDELKKDVLNDESLGIVFMDLCDSIQSSLKMAQADVEVYQSAQARIMPVCGDIVKEFDEEEDHA